MTERPAPAASRFQIGPFPAFGFVAAIAAVGALIEMAYYTTTPALGDATLGTVLGICGALIGFFAWGLKGPRNE
jgi:hypothetical protein